MDGPQHYFSLEQTKSTLKKQWMTYSIKQVIKNKWLFYQKIVWLQGNEKLQLMVFEILVADDLKEKNKEIKNRSDYGGKIKINWRRSLLSLRINQ